MQRAVSRLRHGDSRGSGFLPLLGKALESASELQALRAQELGTTDLVEWSPGTKEFLCFGLCDSG